jgi:hypothetical protein
MAKENEKLPLQESIIEEIKEGTLICCCVHNDMIKKTKKKKKNVETCNKPSELFIQYKNYPSDCWVCYGCWMNCHTDQFNRVWKEKYKILFKKEIKSIEL